jgi:hypothetical protein
LCVASCRARAGVNFNALLTDTKQDVRRERGAPKGRGCSEVPVIHTTTTPLTTWCTNVKSEPHHHQTRTTQVLKLRANACACNQRALFRQRCIRVQHNTRATHDHGSSCGERVGVIGRHVCWATSAVCVCVCVRARISWPPHMSVRRPHIQTIVKAWTQCHAHTNTSTLLSIVMLHEERQ